MTFNLKINNLYISGNIIKTKRKGLSIEISSDSTLQVRASKTLTKKEILEIINNNESWIYKQVSRMKEKNKLFINREYKDGEKYYLLGELYTLNIKESMNLNKVKINKEEQLIELYKSSDLTDTREMLLKFYKDFALKHIINRISYYRSFFEHTPKKVCVKEQKRRWGSCTGDNSLLFNWKIIMAPPKVIDYLIIHEMSHMKHKNHSKDFWNSVESILSDYKELRVWLKNNGITLEL
ncbi:M48 family metallopeptidase [Clostridium massiliamazoniense]|uniref:M48 family metallopeptidase n=1 Tax=Clostridium massiliamazoniense TaxID=1347366 RepID=UPI0006D8107C|nr:SprT family zinc-dependent metalloprotease [Clostridium massiliamazoniense]